MVVSLLLSLQMNSNLYRVSFLEIKNTEEINELDQDRISDHLLNRIEQKKKTKNRNRGPYRKAAVA